MGRVTLNTNCGVTPMNNYLMMGRVCDREDVVKIVTASSSENAEKAFTEHLKIIHDWTDEDIYIEFNELLQDSIDKAIIAE